MTNSGSLLRFIKKYPQEEVEAEIQLRARNKLSSWFPDDGPFRRSLYPKHIEFLAAGATHKERLFVAANRIGKSETGAFESTCHLTGLYPPWWKGRRFKAPVEGWACGTTTETTRDIVQQKLLGPINAIGTGMIPGDLIADTTPRRGVSNAIESVWVKHATGKYSVLGLKTYEQGRSSYEGTAKHFVWYDEEPPLEIYVEGLYRTVTTGGIVYTTFTPLQGMSDTVKSFLEPEKPEEAAKYKWHIQAGWDDVPHILAEEKAALLATTPPHLIAARTKGEPSLGAGAIYPISESEITVSPMAIPDSWPRCFALDVGWNRTAAVWMARDQGSGRIYVYDEHYQSQGEPASHAYAIKSRGDWIPGVIDPASRGRSQHDGMQLLQMYTEMGLKLKPAKNAVQDGLLEVWQAFVSGQLKIFTSCQNLLREFRKYHRDEKGRIVKVDDHALDALRYGFMSGRDLMMIKPVKRPIIIPKQNTSPRGWMA